MSGALGQPGGLGGPRGLADAASGPPEFAVFGALVSGPGAAEQGGAAFFDAPGLVEEGGVDMSGVVCLCVPVSID